VRREELAFSLLLVAACGDPPAPSFEPEVPQTTWFYGDWTRLKEPDEHGSILPKTRRYDKVTIRIPRGFEDEDRASYINRSWHAKGRLQFHVELDTINPERQMRSWSIDNDDKVFLTPGGAAAHMPCVWGDWLRDATYAPQAPVRVVSQERSDGMVGLCLDGGWYVVQTRYLSNSILRCRVFVPAAWAPYALKFLNICKTIEIEPCQAAFRTEPRNINSATCVPERR
jgi:hypothetical protein